MPTMAISAPSLAGDRHVLRGCLLVLPKWVFETMLTVLNPLTTLVTLLKFE